MPKVLLILTRLNIGGPSLQVLLMGRGLRSLGYDTTVVCGRCEEQDGDMSYLVEAEDRMCWLPTMSRSVLPLHDLRSLWHLWRLMRRECPHIVHTHTAKAGTLGRSAAWLAGVPIIVHTFHGNSLEGYFSDPFNRLIRLVERALARVTDAICVLTPQQQEELSEKFRIAAPRKFRMVPLGLELDGFLSLPEPAPAPKHLTVGWLGRLVPVKGIPLLVSVMEAALARNPGFRFLVAGDGPEREILVRAAERFGSDSVRWLGWQKDVTSLLTQCDVLIQTSRNEGTPVALIQGMAAARPFVSTPAGGVVDLVTGSRRAQEGAEWFDNAVLVPPDAAVFARVLERLSAEPSLIPQMGRAGRRLVAARFPKALLLQNLDGLYRELLQGKNLDIDFLQTNDLFLEDKPCNC